MKNCRKKVHRGRIEKTRGEELRRQGRRSERDKGKKCERQEWKREGRALQLLSSPTCMTKASVKPSGPNDTLGRQLTKVKDPTPPRCHIQDQALVWGFYIRESGKILTTTMMEHKSTCLWKSLQLPGRMDTTSTGTLTCTCRNHLAQTARDMHERIAKELCTSSWPHLDVWWTWMRDRSITSLAKDDL